jgi:hypothetical protein
MAQLSAEIHVHFRNPKDKFFENATQAAVHRLKGASARRKQACGGLRCVNCL